MDLLHEQHMDGIAKQIRLSNLTLIHCSLLFWTFKKKKRKEIGLYSDILRHKCELFTTTD